jgi:hypothetical protein
MKKDIIIAIILGFVTGSLVAAIILNFPYILSIVNKKKDTTAAVIQPNIKKDSTALITLDILDPQDDSLAATKSMTIRGKTQKDNTVILEFDLNQDVTSASDDGNFTFPVNLNYGTNDILLTAYNQNGESVSKTVSVMYQDEDL